MEIYVAIRYLLIILFMISNQLFTGIIYIFISKMVIKEGLK